MIYKSKMFTEKNEIWDSKTPNMGAVKACLLSDGKFVVSDERNVEVWSSPTGNLTGPEIYARIEDSGNLAIYEGSKRRWSSGFLKKYQNYFKRFLNFILDECLTSLRSGFCMKPEELLCSSNGSYVLRLRDDGNLVLYKGTQLIKRNSIWSSETFHKELLRACLNPDGNFVIYNVHKHRLWTSRSNSLNASDVYAGIDEENGSFVIHSGGKEIWSSGLLLLEALCLFYLILPKLGTDQSSNATANSSLDFAWSLATFFVHPTELLR